MDKLEQHIKDHREDFDVFHPSSNLWSKIESALPAQDLSKDHNRNLIYLITRIAAIIVFVLIAGIGAGYFLGLNKSLVGQQPGSPMADLQMTEQFYTQKVSLKLNEINKLTLPDQGYISEMAELEKNYEEMKLQLDIVPEDKRDFVIYKMIDNYKQRIALLELILDKSIHNTKKHNNEKNINI